MIGGASTGRSESEAAFPGAQLADLARRTGRSATSILDEAVRALHQSLVGGALEAVPTALPFKKLLSDFDADVVLRQVDPTSFLLAEPFRFRHGDGHETVVPQGDVTDLASVPDLLTWLVPRYGRHTLPTLLHDFLVVPGMPVDQRAAADEIFRDAMGATLVPLVRRWLMWAAVSAATDLKRPLPERLATGAWIAGHFVIGTDLALSVVARRRLPGLRRIPRTVLVLSPAVTALAWKHRYRFGAISAFATMAMPVPLLAVGTTLVLYLGAEGAAAVYLKCVGRRANPVWVNQTPKTARHPRTERPRGGPPGAVLTWGDGHR